jgi:glyoxylase-like metal-dependent hydrolase (beta-lactamase superfamily II)
MKKIVCYFIFTLILIIPCRAEDDVQFQIRRLSDRTIVLTGGRNNGNTIVVASEKGLIIIDTNWSQYFAKKIKETVKREMGRDDYAYVINTHGHGDHTGGNQMFPTAEIIGHGIRGIRAGQSRKRKK